MPITSVITYTASDKETEEHNTVCTMMRTLEGRLVAQWVEEALNVYLTHSMLLKQFNLLLRQRSGQKRYGAVKSAPESQVE